MSIIGEDALTRAVSLCFPPADRLHHNNQAVLLKWNFPSVPQKGRLSCEYIRSLFKVTGCWWRLFYMSKKKLFAVDLCSVTSLSSCYLFSDVSPGSSSVWTLTLRGFLLYEKRSQNTKWTFWWMLWFLHASKRRDHLKVVHSEGIKTLCTADDR